ncbi:MAG: cold shock domain-containing protein [Bacteroidales bacterium]|nr:cold shock domain-containing protein [Bacteroidales bacterium]NCA77466.1 cold shock domain-containing protein [Alphaproteobacteria bacterium]HNW75082.1 cold shock domain-containing protein [Bacteroidales bacterium]HPS51271.1 cold shock domain-containing protein [Bacteroidales bacterium]
MSTGKVKFFNERKGFGFIIDDEGQQEVFVHVSGLVDKIRENDQVSFDITEDKRGKKAINVRKD